MYAKNIFIILVFFTLRCAANFVFKISVPQAQKGCEPLLYGVKNLVGIQSKWSKGSAENTTEISKKSNPAIAVLAWL